MADTITPLTEEEVQRRQAWFAFYVGRTEEAYATPREPILLPSGKWYACPCCGYPTLGERGNYDICSLCFWEDDGQDDPRADERWGGPNSDYSLTEARRNFRRHLHMYRNPEGIWGPRYDNNAAMAIKREAMALYQALVKAEGAEAIQLEEQMREKERLLRNQRTNLPR